MLATPARLGERLERLSHKYSIEPVTRKSLAYFAEYERILAPIQNDKIRILELGVYDAASILIWRDFLPNAIIIGIDSAPKHARFPNDSRLKYLKGLQDDPLILDRAIELAGGPFHMVTDDCAHIGSVAKRSFFHLFDKHVISGGSYVIEDIGTSFLAGRFPDAKSFVEPINTDREQAAIDFPSHQNGLVGFVKQLIDHSQRDVATQSFKTVPIERVSIISNMAIIQRS